MLAVVHKTCYFVNYISPALSRVKTNLTASYACQNIKERDIHSCVCEKSCTRFVQRDCGVVHIDWGCGVIATSIVKIYSPDNYSIRSYDFANSPLHHHISIPSAVEIPPIRRPPRNQVRLRSVRACGTTRALLSRDVTHTRSPRGFAKNASWRPQQLARECIPRPPSRFEIIQSRLLAAVPCSIESSRSHRAGVLATFNDGVHDVAMLRELEFALQ